MSSTRSGLCPTAPSGIADTAICQNAKGIGACWAVIADKYRLILFGRYPYDEQWRPAIVVLLFIGLYVVSAMRRFWRKELALLWIATLTVVGLLMWGGVLGLTEVSRGFLGRTADHPDPGDLRRWPSRSRWRSLWRLDGDRPGCRR